MRNVYNARKPYTERDVRQTECLLPIRQANGPNLRCDSGKSHEQNCPHKLSHGLTKER